MNSTTKIAMVCITLLSVAGCGTTPPNTNAPGASPVAPGAVSKDENPLDVLSKAVMAQLAAKSFRARMVSSVAGTESTSVVECISPDQFHITGDTEMILTGGNAYMKAPNGEWTKLMFDVSDMISQVRDAKRLDEIRKSTDVALVGAETVDGVPALVYRYSMKDPFGMKLTSNCKMWVGVADSLPRRLEVEGEFKKTKSRSAVTYYDYGADIKIEPPASYKTQGDR